MILFIRRTDGGISVMRVSAGADAAQALAKWRALHVASYRSHREGAEGEIPPDRSFRDAWRDTGAAIEHDLPQCRLIALDRLQRAGRLEAAKIAAVAAARSPAELKIIDPVIVPS